MIIIHIITQAYRPIIFVTSNEDNDFNYTKEAKSATMNIFRKKNLFKAFVKVELSYVFTISIFTIAESARKSELLYQMGVCLLFLVIICVPPIIIGS